MFNLLLLAFSLLHCTRGSTKCACQIASCTRMRIPTWGACIRTLRNGSFTEACPQLLTVVPLQTLLSDSTHTRCVSTINLLDSITFFNCRYLQQFTKTPTHFSTIPSTFTLKRTFIVVAKCSIACTELEPAVLYFEVLYALPL